MKLLHRYLVHAAVERQPALASSHSDQVTI